MLSQAVVSEREGLSLLCLQIHSFSLCVSFKMYIVFED